VNWGGYFNLFAFSKFCDAGREVEEAEVCVQNSGGADINWANETTAAWSYQW